MKIFIILLLSCCFIKAETKIKVESYSNFTVKDIERFNRIISNLETILNSQSFKDFILNHKVENNKTFLENDNKSNEQIYINLLEGKETLSPIKDFTWQLVLNKKYIIPNSTLAYTDRRFPVIHFNSRYIDRGNDASIAGTICHEYSHKLGYSHEGKDRKKWSYTVPYSVGRICSQIYSTLYPIRTRTIDQSSSCGLLCRIRGIFN